MLVTRVTCSTCDAQLSLLFSTTPRTSISSTRGSAGDSENGISHTPLTRKEADRFLNEISLILGPYSEIGLQTHFKMPLNKGDFQKETLCKCSLN